MIPMWEEHPLRHALQRAGERIGRVASHVTPVGRVAVVLGVAAAVVARISGWDEFSTVAGGLAVGLLIGIVCTIGRQQLDVSMTFEPSRVVAGESAIGSVKATNTWRRRLLPFRLEAPIGESQFTCSVPSLAPEAVHEEVFVLPTERRACLVVGPFSSVRGDPVGLIARRAAWTKPDEFYIHPATVSLGSLASGWLRDLEGVATNDLSSNDVAFHTLREYQPGDDRRHVHWKSSAKSGKLMVRQFVDTRRSHLGMMLSDDIDEYLDPEDFELAVSAVGSLGRRALRDDQEVTCCAGNRGLNSATATQLLDSLSGVEMREGSGLNQSISATLTALSSVSVVALITGSGLDVATLRANAERFPRELRVVGIRVQRGAASGVRVSGTVTILDLGDLESLDSLIRAVSA